MSHEQRFTERHKEWHMVALIAGLTVGFILQVWGEIYHAPILQGLGLTVFYIPIIAAVTVSPRRSPSPWSKKRTAVTIGVSLLVGCVLFILGLSYHNYVFDGLSLIVYIAPLLLPWIIKRGA